MTKQPKRVVVRNPRRQVLDELRKVKDWAQHMVSLWSDTPSKRWYDAGDGRGVTYQTELRTEIPASEYRENDPKHWDDLAEYMAAIQYKARAIQEFAEQQAFRLRDKV